MKDRPTGIIRTLPSLYGDGKQAAQNFWNHVKDVETGKKETVSIALAQKPKIEILYMYLLVNGEINVRLNIVEYVAGTEEECFDKTYRKPKFWAICSAPVSRPLEPIKRRGFQGFRYTGDLW